jgi:signal transduction histidine kinase
LAQQARESGTEGEVAPLTPSSSDPEIIELVETFNGLMKRVHASAESKARFYAAASHELRTPLQALLGHLELSVSRERSAEEMQATIGESLVQTRRLIGLVEGILLLQRIDSERGTREPVDAAVVVRECLDQVEPPVVSEIADSAQVLSYSSHLEILFVNLLSNAIRHGKEDSVEVRLSEGRLTVSNLVLAGVKVEAEELKAPFSSAYRSRASDVAGNGLGLAICRSICEANQWTLEIQVEPTRFVVQVSF